MSSKKLQIIFGKKIQNTLPYIFIIGGVVGLIASFILTIEHIDIVKDPLHQLSCSIDPVLACGPIMNSKEATIFGFPNPLIGLVVFGAQIMLGAVMLAGAKMKSWFWKLYGLITAGSLTFSLWLIYHSLYIIEAICIYCFVVWLLVFATSWYLFQFMLAENHIKTISARLKKFLRKHHGDMLAIIYLILAILILNKFWYYYGPKLGF